MTEREWTNVSQELACEFCGTTVPRKINIQRFCSDSCRVEYWNEKIEANCIVCNDKFLKPKRKPTQTCSQFCREVFFSVERSRFTDDEIIHLALLNKGFGVKPFTRMLCKDSKATNEMKDRLHDIREILLEDTQIDLYQILNDDSDWMKGRVWKPSRAPGSSRSWVWSVLPKINHDRKKLVGFNWGPYQEK